MLINDLVKRAFDFLNPLIENNIIIDGIMTKYQKEKGILETGIDFTSYLRELKEDLNGESLFNSLTIKINKRLRKITIKARFIKHKLEFGLLYFTSLQKQAEEMGFSARLGIRKPFCYFDYNEEE